MSSTSPHDAAAACDRVAAMVERSLAMEGRGRPVHDDAIRVPLVRYALALLRMRIRPALEPGWMTADPVHVAMFGGTNSGKSTVLNVLLGRDAAGMSYRARFSQHPEAYRPSWIGDQFLDAYPSRFAGYRRVVNGHAPRQDDQDLRARGYLPALAVNDPAAMNCPLLADPAASAAVFWDIPDFSTEEALAYMPAVLDTIALADLVVMSLTKENYADYRALLLRGLVIGSGVPVRVVANKLEDGSRLLDDITRKLGEGDASARVPLERIHPLPHVPAADEHERLKSLLAGGNAGSLRDAVAADVACGPILKRQALAGTLRFLETRLDDILAPLRAEADVAAYWADTVRRLAEADFHTHYRRDYHESQDYGDFNLAVVKFLDLLELPVVGQYISHAARLARKPFQWAKKGLKRLLKRVDEPSASKPPEEEVVLASYERWLSSLKAEAQRQAELNGHPAWSQLASRLDSRDFLDDLENRLAEAYLVHRDAMTRLIEDRARSLWEFVGDRPNLRRTLQGAKFATDLSAILSVIAVHGLDPTDLIIAPLVAPAVRLVMEFVGEQAMEAQKQGMKDEQAAAMRRVIDEFMVRPVQGLFPGTIRSAELAAVRADLALVSRVALDAAGGASR
jgi:hypothetical protein